MCSSMSKKSQEKTSQSILKLFEWLKVIIIILLHRFVSHDKQCKKTAFKSQFQICYWMDTFYNLLVRLLQCINNQFIVSIKFALEVKVNFLLFIRMYSICLTVSQYFFPTLESHIFTKNRVIFNNITIVSFILFDSWVSKFKVEVDELVNHSVQQNIIIHYSQPLFA